MTSQIWIIKHSGGRDPASHLQQVLHSTLRAHCLKGGGNIRTGDSRRLESNSICWIWQGHCTHKPNNSCDCMPKNRAPHWGAMYNGQLLGGWVCFLQGCSSRSLYMLQQTDLHPCTYRSTQLSTLKKNKNKRVHEVGGWKLGRGETREIGGEGIGVAFD